MDRPAWQRLNRHERSCFGCRLPWKGPLAGWAPKLCSFGRKLLDAAWTEALKV